MSGYFLHMHNQKQSSPFKKIIRSFKPAIAGIAAAFRSQLNFKVHALIAIAVLFLSYFLHLSPIEWCIILFCIGSVFVSELINTSLEVTVDIASPHIQDKAGLAKDLAAGAVLVSAIVSAIIGLIIFIPKILLYF